MAPVTRSQALARNIPLFQPIGPRTISRHRVTAPHPRVFVNGESPTLPEDYFAIMRMAQAVERESQRATPPPIACSESLTATEDEEVSSNSNPSSVPETPLPMPPLLLPPPLRPRENEYSVVAPVIRFPDPSVPLADLFESVRVPQTSPAREVKPTGLENGLYIPRGEGSFRTGPFKELTVTNTLESAMIAARDVNSDHHYGILGPHGWDSKIPGHLNHRCIVPFIGRHFGVVSRQEGVDLGPSGLDNTPIYFTSCGRVDYVPYTYGQDSMFKYTTMCMGATIVTRPPPSPGRPTMSTVPLTISLHEDVGPHGYISCSDGLTLKDMNMALTTPGLVVVVSETVQRYIRRSPTIYWVRCTLVSPHAVVPPRWSPGGARDHSWYWDDDTPLYRALVTLF